MKLIKNILKDIVGLDSKLRKIEILKDSKYPLVKRNVNISDGSEMRIFGILDCYDEFFKKLVDKKQYLFFLKELGVIRAFYKFSEEGDKLVEGRLVFYPLPDKFSEQGDFPKKLNQSTIQIIQ